jgi:hypothetical protein
LVKNNAYNSNEDVENQITNEELTNSGDDLTFLFSAYRIKDGSIDAIEETNVTSDINSYDYPAGSITFGNTHTGTVLADYTWEEETNVTDETLTNTGDDLNFDVSNSPIQEDTVTTYETTDVKSDEVM